MTARDPADLSFETSRVKARLLCEDDLDLYLALYTAPEVMRYIGPVMGREAAEAQFRKAIALNGECAMRIRYWVGSSVDHEGALPLGILSAAWGRPAPRAVEIGIMLSGHAQRSGNGKELLSGLIHFVLMHSVGEAAEVVARHHVENVGADTLFSKLGFSSSSSEDGEMSLRALVSQKWFEYHGAAMAMSVPL